MTPGLRIACPNVAETSGVTMNGASRILWAWRAKGGGGQEPVVRDIGALERVAGGRQS